MDDPISRQAAIDAWNGDFNGFVNLLNLSNIQRDDYKDIMEYIDEAPSVQPERKIFSKMTGAEFEEWLYEHGICHPDIHESISCDVVPLLIDDAINELPSAQPEIIRCRDCAHADKYYHCSLVEWWTGPDDYCSRAERKE